MIRRIAIELKSHAPFTMMGAAGGIMLMFFLKGLPHNISYYLFYTMHPLHVLMSAVVTTSILRIYRFDDHAGDRWKLAKLLAIGYFGSVGVGTISDSMIPYFGELLLGFPHAEAHIGFVEEWWLVNPSAFIGIAIGYKLPRTKMPHSGHVMISTCASLLHMVMALGPAVHWYTYLILLLLLFVSVWVPCCFSDIAFPLLFVSERNKVCIHSCCHSCSH
jgi:hypothetical protein